MKARYALAVLALSTLGGIALNAPRNAACGPAGCGTLLAAAAAKPKARPAPRKPAAVQHFVTVTYFHANVRCASCRTIEAWTQAAVRDNFAADLKAGRLRWRAINVDEPGNQHYLKDYQLYTKSVIVSDLRAGKETRWKNLDRVWTLLRDEAAFKAYVRDEVKLYLKGT